MKLDKNKVVLGMSGGVDSSVAAKLLTDAGYDVTGVTLKLWEPPGEVENRRWQDRTCCKVGVARYVSSKVGICHEVYEAEQLFSADVIDYFCSEYKMARTPNPCVVCNEKVKFKLLFEFADKIGAFYVATGHYVRLGTIGPYGPFLRKGAYHPKDQSYFLYRISSDLLERLLFPLGDISKDDVWKTSESISLPADEVKESQEICFVTQEDYRDFLREKIPSAFKKGNFTDTTGNIIGEHSGLANYTVGQRRGLGVSALTRLYVVGLEIASNRVILGGKEEIYRSGLVADDINIFFDPEKNADLLESGISARIRYRSGNVPVTQVMFSHDSIRCSFKTPQAGVTPGQSVVFYKDDIVIGGGVIKDTTQV